MFEVTLRTKHKGSFDHFSSTPLSQSSLMATTPTTQSSDHSEEDYHYVDSNTGAHAHENGYTTQLERKTAPPTKDKRGGKIVKPHEHHFPTGSTWENSHRGKIPLDRGGKHLPRYMQETNVSKTKLAYKHTDQQYARMHRTKQRSAKTAAVDLVGQHRELLNQVKHLTVQRSEWIRHDKALDIDLEQAKHDLQKLTESDAGEKHETTRARLEREFNSFQKDMQAKIQHATEEAENVAIKIEHEHQQHLASIDLLENQHRMFVEEKKQLLEDITEQITAGKIRNKRYMMEHEDQIRKAEEVKLDAEARTDAVEQSGTALHRALVVECAMDLHNAKLFNAKQYQQDTQKYQNITAHLTMEVEQLSSSLEQATAERDMLMEESRMYGLVQ
jgi:hypothetical protein